MTKLTPEGEQIVQALESPVLTGTRQLSRYAYFAQIRRLAAGSGGRVEVYDTTGFNIASDSIESGLT